MLGIGCFLRWGDNLFSIGSKHCKFFWREEGVLLEEIEDEVAETHKSKCPVVVFDIEDLANGKCDCIYSLMTT